mgnify:FL=1
MLELNRQIGTISTSFTPQFYKKALDSATHGNYRQLIAMFDYAETDSWIQGCLEGRLDGFKRRWTLNEASDDLIDVEVKEFVLSVFNNLDMRDLFEKIWEARIRKYKVIDFDFEVINGKQVITKFNDYHQDKK